MDWTVNAAINIKPHLLRHGQCRALGGDLNYIEVLPEGVGEFDQPFVLNTNSFISIH